LPIITEEVYKDSDKYTYRDTGSMYDSGAGNSNLFKEGIILEKAPQIRFLYYGAYQAGAKNRNAIPQWFERTKTENINKYKKMLAKGIECAK
jgi:hypothetical protein